MLPEQSTLVIRDKMTTTRAHAVLTSPRIPGRGDLTKRQAQLNYRALIYSDSACGDSRSHDRCYPQHNRYSHC
jgi:hypothetical protein